MKAKDVRELIDALVVDMVGDYGTPSRVREARRILAEAFRAGVRSSGLRYQSDAKLKEICGVGE